MAAPRLRARRSPAVRRSLFLEGFPLKTLIGMPFAGRPTIPVETAKAAPRVKMKPEKAKTNITNFVSLATHKRLKQHALDNNTSLQQILDEALDTYFSVRGLPPIERTLSLLSQKERVIGLGVRFAQEMRAHDSPRQPP